MTTLFDLARMTVSSSGTGDITLSAAVSGFLTFDLAGCSTASTGQLVSYAISDTTQSEIGTATYYSSASALRTRTPERSTNGNSAIQMSNSAQVFVTPRATDLGPNIPNCGQLQYIGATQIALFPYNGDMVKIAGSLYTIPSGSVSIGNGGLLSSTVYYAYVYMSAGTMTLELSTTSPARDTTAGNVGVYIKTGDSTRSLVGAVRTTTGAQFNDANAQRFTRSWFNRQPVPMRGSYINGVTSASVGAFVELDGTKRIEGVFFSDDMVTISIDAGSVQNNSAGQTCYFQVGMDGVAAGNQIFSGSIAQGCTSTSVIFNNTSTANLIPGVGYHYFTLLGQVSGGTGTFYGALSGTVGG